jgi:hypothetical protein
MKLFDKFGCKVVLVVVKEGSAFIGTFIDTIEEPSALVITNSYYVNQGSQGYAEAPTTSAPTNAIELMIPVGNIMYIVQPKWINDGPWAVKKEN